MARREPWLEQSQEAPALARRRVLVGAGPHALCFEHFSFGLAFDGGGDDLLVGARHAQGLGVHQAIGMHWEAGGKDRCACESVAHAGMAWDEVALRSDAGVGVFLDGAARDAERALAARSLR